MRPSIGGEDQVDQVRDRADDREGEDRRRRTHQIPALVARPFPHWRLRMATLAGAASTSRAMAKLLGFQRCRPRYCSTYFEAIARKPPSANGQSRSTRGLIRSARLMPVM